MKKSLRQLIVYYLVLKRNYRMFQRAIYISSIELLYLNNGTLRDMRADRL